MLNSPSENNTRTQEANPSESGYSYISQPPAVSLPRGGGAIKGIGEKFALNPVTGTGSLIIPIFTSPGRSGFSPQLSLNYDSGTGNGVFGLGWLLSVPSITRKTEKGLPQYLDGEDTDTFIISGAEDLVPTLVKSGEKWSKDIQEVGEYLVQRYRPRVEGLFARIERWQHRLTTEVHWRSHSKDNITSIYGQSVNSRIFDPTDDSRVFQWLLEESYDDKGNVIHYEYKQENTDGVNPACPQEKNRLANNQSYNHKYLKRIWYGNTTPGDRSEWLFQVVFDHGEHQQENPTPAEVQPWQHRLDGFSNFRSRFEIRTQRLCQRVLMFHRFAELDADWCLVRSTDFTYAENPVATYLVTATQTGYVKDSVTGNYHQQSYPPVEFSYDTPEIDEEVKLIDGKSLENLPIGLDGGLYQWVDLDGEGISGILTEQATGWFYKRNLGNAKFSPLELVATKPSVANLQNPQQRLMDLGGDGQLDLVLLERSLSGYYQRDLEENWHHFQPFSQIPNLDWNDPNLRLIDLNGDGHGDILISEDQVFVWYPSQAKEGFGKSARVWKFPDEEKNPALVFADSTQSIYLADMSGDGLNDIVRIRNGEVCYWPNLGCGQFGTKVTMDGSPYFDHPELFNQNRLRLADIDSSGTTDMIYLGREAVSIRFNQAGNSWSEPHHLTNLPTVDNLASVQTVDLLGNGTACLVWSSTLPQQQMRYIDLMGGKKPHLLIANKNNLGAETKLKYTSSTKFYLADQAAGQPWITKLPFPVQVVEKVETYDHLTGNRFVSRYRYHHGYFDGEEREFRGFGFVEQWDTEEYEVFQTGESTNVLEKLLHIPPIYTKTWFHTGVYLDREHIANFFVQEYYREPGATDTAFLATLLPDTILPDGLTVKEEKEACRVLRGQVLRQEVYALDGTEKAQHPYTVTESNYEIRPLQPSPGESYGVFFVYPRESIAYHYERNPQDPRVVHEMTLAIDDFGNVLKSLSIAYPRCTPEFPEQGKTYITYTENQVFNQSDRTLDWYRLGVPIETKTYEIARLATPQIPLARGEVLRQLEAITEIPYESFPDGTLQKRLVEQERILYRANSQANTIAPEPLPLGEVDSLALPAEGFKLAFTPGLLAQVYGSKVNNDLLANEGGYVQQDGLWWIPSGRQNFDSNKFYLTTQIQDPFGEISTTVYDSYSLLGVETRDALPSPQTNIVQISNDYRTLQPQQLTDANGNRSQVAFDTLGMVVGTAVMGKETEIKGDSLTSFKADLDQEERDRFFANPIAEAANLLGTATTRIVYDLDRFRTSGQPVLAATLARETHVSDLEFGNSSKMQISFLYSDGFGRELQSKVQAEEGLAPQRNEQGQLRRNGEGALIFTDTDYRWMGTGRTVYNNKGKPVKQYEPFFSSTHRYEDEQELVEYGVTPIIFYDPLERAITTLHPNHTYDKVVFDPWRQETWDVNDTLTVETREDFQADADVGGYFQGLEAGDYLPTWFTRYSAGTPAQRDAANKAASQAGTPSVVHLDTLGRPFLTIADNGIGEDGTPQLYETHVELDIEGQQLFILDARQNAVMVYGTISQDGDGRLVKDSEGKPVIGVRAYDLLGNNLYSYSMDAGERWMLSNVAGNPIRGWDVNNRVTTTGEEVLEERQFQTVYDALQRPLEQRLSINGEVGQTIERFIYGEGQASDRDRNLKGQPYQHYDPSGLMTNVSYDFKGNLLEVQRLLARDYEAAMIDWRGDNLTDGLETETFSRLTEYDALNRLARLYNWHSHPDQVTVYEPRYNQRGVLQGEDLIVGAQQRDDGYTGGTRTTAIIDITYDAKGQRESIHYGNNTITRYDYDPLTFRLQQLRTTRPSYNPAFPRHRSNLRDDKILQQLSYTYDPVGNITEIYDEAYEPVFFSNQRVEPRSRYQYDALYRLVEVRGRENITNTEPRQQETDFPRVSFPRSDQALRNYIQSYTYDAVGNILRMHHHGGLGTTEEIWTRNYSYASDSNRLLQTWLGRNEAEAVEYGYDLHGSMLNLNRSPEEYRLRWDYRDMIHAANLGGGGWAYYNYDASKQRTRKVITNREGVKQWERFYLGGMEVYRRYGVSGMVEEIETHHLFADEQRVLIVEDVLSTDNSSLARGTLFRYQYGNHLGSVGLEMDGDAGVISYEEYHPYGTTAYRGMSCGVQAVAKRYRYTGMERDEETGLSYHTARFYLLWLGRWLSADPIGIEGGMNVYGYVYNNSITLNDLRGMQAGRDPTMVDGRLTSRVVRENLDRIEALRNQWSWEEDIEQPFAADNATDGGRELRWAASRRGDGEVTVYYFMLNGRWRRAYQGGAHAVDDTDYAVDAITAGGGFVFRRIVREGAEELAERVVREGTEEVTERVVREGTEEAVERVAREAESIASEAAEDALPTVELRLTDAAGADLRDANTLRFFLEWLNESGPLIRATRPEGDDAIRAVIRAALRTQNPGNDILGRLHLAHIVDSAAAGSIEQGGRTVYSLALDRVNTSFGAQLGNQFRRLGIEVGDAFNVRFIDFPSMTTHPPRFDSLLWGPWVSP